MTGASVLSDPVANTPVRPAAGRMLPGLLIPQQVADAVSAEQMSEAAPEPGLIQTRALPPPSPGSSPE